MTGTRKLFQYDYKLRMTVFCNQDMSLCLVKINFTGRFFYSDLWYKMILIARIC